MDHPGGSGRQQPPLPPMTPLPLARQGSVYSLTFDEFQTTLGGAGKDFGSMNMDELLRNIWMAEESHAIAAPAATTSAAAAAAAADHAAGAPIQRQGSLTLPRTLSQKTVDEVWRDMMCFGTPAAAASPPAQRQQTLGEITLEEFLVRAGMVREDMAAGRTVPPVPAALPPPPQPPMLFPQSNAFAPMVPPLSVGNGLMTGTVGQGGGGAATVVSQGRPDWPVTSTSNGFGKTEGGNLSSLSPQQVVSLVRPVTSNGFGKMEGGDLSSLSPPPAPYVFNGGLRGRKASAMEKVVERRQRRMIKNRESATRSRQRKQAYMMELEAEVAKLKELNEELQKKQVEMIEKQKNEVLERITRQIGPKSKRICLRRTLTGPW